MSPSSLDIIKSFERRLVRFIEDNDMPRPGGRLIVGLSGGADSSALAVALSALGYEIVAAHCNFHLRGDESMRDSRQARFIADKLDIDIHVRDFDVSARMTQCGESLEMACRSLRYEWFLDLLEQHEACAVAVGHHCEDNAETLMLNLLRGTGVAGLAGIRPRRDHVIRPLLDFSRSEIEEYLRAKQISWVEDSSNNSDAFRRNALRLNVLPYIEKEFPGANDAIVRTARNVAASRALSDIAIARLAESYISVDNDNITRIDCDHIARDFGKHIGSPATALIFEIIRPFGFGIDTAKSVMRAMTAMRSGLHFNSQTHDAWFDRGTLIIETFATVSPKSDIVEVSLSNDILSPIHIQISEHSIDEFAPTQGDNTTIYLDSSVLDESPCFTIRTWRIGDRLEPYGMNGKSKLVSDIFTDARLSPRGKERALLLCRNEIPLWVIGIRASCHFAVTAGTHRYLSLRLHL